MEMNKLMYQQFKYPCTDIMQEFPRVGQSSYRRPVALLVKCLILKIQSVSISYFLLFSLKKNRKSSASIC